MTEEAAPLWTPEAWDKACCDYTNASADGAASETAYTELIRLYRLGRKIDPSIRLPWQAAFGKPRS